MSGPPAIEVRGVSKRYPRKRQGLKLLYQTVTRQDDGEGFTALHDVSFSVPKGTSLGIVGRNGSGKSTLLQLICGTLTPSLGSVRTTGRIAAMLELGAGFNSDFTGRENIFLAASVYGLADEQIADRLHAIEAFADIGDYIERPVSEYSSGMYARLAFAVCAHVDADILVVDEILGVGDAAFQRKCEQFMQDFRRRGTLIFVSHSAGSVLRACERAIWLEAGGVVGDGPAEEVLRQYVGDDVSRADDEVPAEPVRALDTWMPDLRLGERNVVEVSPFDPDCPRHGFGGASIVTCYFSAGDGYPLTRLHGGQVVTLHVLVDVSEPLTSPIVGYMFRNATGQNLFGDNTFLTYRENPPSFCAGSRLEARMAFRMPYLPRGTFTLAPSLLSGTQTNHRPVTWLEDALVLRVTGDAVRHGKVGMVMHGFRAEAGAGATEPQ